MSEPEESKPSTSESKSSGLFDSPWAYLLAIPAIVVIWLVIVKSRSNAEVADLAPDQATVAAHPLVDDDSAALADALAKVWAGEAVDRKRLPARLLESAQPVYVAFRVDGRRLYQLWRDPKDLPQGGTMWDVLLQAIEDGRRGLGDNASRITRLEVDLTHSYRRHNYADPDERRLLLDIDKHKIPHHLGVRGLQVKHGDKFERYAPSTMIVTNRRVPKQLERLREKTWHMDEETFAQAEFSTFEADQFLVRLDTTPVEVELMFRGNRIVDISEVNKKSTEALAQGMLKWLVNNLREDGRLTYLYWPASEKESKGNNMIRQWMATNALVRWAIDRNDQAVFDQVEQNIDYNLEQFFYYERNRERVTLAEGELPGEDTVGVIEYRGKTKLGGVGLAGMAMWLHPKRDKWIQEINGLRRMVDYLWHDDGSFTSFYKGSDKEYFNFYPGEAMLFWATIYADTKDPEILRKFKLSFDYHRSWHLEEANRNPAFVPWHIQADYAMWTSLGPEEQVFKDEMQEFMFETADWLVETMQQWDEDEYVHADERGRFYAPRGKFGVPHASSTGVYLEGLIDAWKLARDIGYDAKREYYRVAMIRALRSMMQLQFVDDVDMFYISAREYVEGGIRTTVFDSEIRCDNVQHPMMGIIKLLREFEDSEYDNAE